MLKTIRFSLFFILLFVFSCSIAFSHEVSFKSQIEMAIFISRIRAMVHSHDIDYDKLAKYQEGLKIPEDIPYDLKKALYDLRKSSVDLCLNIESYSSFSGVAKYIGNSFVDFFTLNPKGMYKVLKDNYDVFLGEGVPEQIKNAAEKTDKYWKDVCFMMTQFGFSTEGLNALALHFSNNENNKGGQVQNTIAIWFAEAKNLPYSIHLAITFFEMAIKENNIDALKNLSKVYYYGGFSKKDKSVINYDKALYYADLACKNDSADSDFNKYYQYIKNSMQTSN